MNQETNNEIDLMLRKLGRQSVTVSTSNADEVDDHLDADELNMYAENALSSTARARYTEHLADCTHCRQIVSQLTIPGGLVVREKKTEAPTPTGIKALLASFFSPIVLRYAVPALGLLIVASIGVLVLRDSGYEQMTAQKDVSSSIAKNESQAVQPLENSGFVNSNEAAARNVAGKSQPPAKPAESPRSDLNEADTAKESADRKRDEPAKTTDQVAAAPATAGASATPNPKPAVADEAPKAGQDVGEKKKQPAEDAAATSEVAKTQAKGEEQRKLGAAGLARSEPGTARRSPPSSVQQRVRENEANEGGRRADKDDAETRTVAGRQFRREGSAWIDVAYSSQATTNVTRGSEQYRALVADEPALKTIADQLGGEVIVVWKSRAYRIR